MSTKSKPHRAWLPPLVSVATLFALFASAVAVRQSPFAEGGRPVMIALSAIAAAVIALYGAVMIVQGRVRGVASIVAGLVMVVLGLYTANHVLR
jgi:CHASE2 domain-containing sensor protein